MEHDELCPRAQNLQVLTACQCDLIRQVQERERALVAGQLYAWADELMGEDDDE